MAKQNFYVNRIKPFGDLLVGLMLLIMLFPIILITAVVILIDLKSSPFFIQDRVGKQERVFKLIKLKTMKIEDDESSATSRCKFIRSYSLDELPQIVNVILGDMSIVGPRPLLVEYLPHYNEKEKRRHLVKPGITGWAQVNGRNSIDWSERMALDTYYVEHVSFRLDLRILRKSIVEVLKRDKTVYKDDVTIKFSDYVSKR